MAALIAPAAFVLERGVPVLAVAVVPRPASDSG